MIFGEYTFIQTDVAVEADRHFVAAQLRQFNNVTSPHHLYIRTNPPRPLDLFVRDADGAIMAALVSDSYWGWLDVDDLWVHEALRGRGIGAHLLHLAERAAQRRDCQHVKLTTFSFQARGFYEKRGYRVAGALEDYPPGATYFWLRKDFPPAGSPAAQQPSAQP